jgi:hypothetical protein
MRVENIFLQPESMANLTRCSSIPVAEIGLTQFELQIRIRRKVKMTQQKFANVRYWHSSCSAYVSIRNSCGAKSLRDAIRGMEKTYGGLSGEI